jgi:predicted adenylyl cyclase CyaB
MVSDMPGQDLPRRRNLEVKARYPELDAARAVCQQVGARPEGVQVQTDVYFHVPRGRLKLRRIEGQPAVLIWYDRPDEAGTRASDYYLTPVSDADLLEATLTAALGVRWRVHKRRDVLHFHNVRIHLDDVDLLGSFLELEAVISGQADEVVSRQRLDQLLGALGLTRTESLAGSYADLLGL